MCSDSSAFKPRLFQSFLPGHCAVLQVTQNSVTACLLSIRKTNKAFATKGKCLKKCPRSINILVRNNGTVTSVTSQPRTDAGTADVTNSQLGSAYSRDIR